MNDAHRAGANRLQNKQLRVYGAISDWCAELAQQISDHSFYSTGRPAANMSDESECRASPNVVSILTNPPWTNVPVQGDLLRSHHKRFETLPEDIRVMKAGENAIFMRSISLGHYFMTIHDTDDGFGSAGSCREFT